MTKVAVVTAFNPSNAGMYSVDLAAIQFLKSLNFKFSLYRAHVYRRRLPVFIDGTRLKYLKNQKPFEKADVVLYWGDFINNPVYAIEDFREREFFSGRSTEKYDALEKWKELFLLKGFSAKEQKVLSVSNNFQSASSALRDVGNKNHQEIVELFNRNFDAIFPRDPESTTEMQNTLNSPVSPRIECGVDAAFLVQDHHVGKLPLELKPGGYFTYFFGRSQINNADRILSEVSKATGLKPICLNKWLSLSFRGWDKDFSEMTTLIYNSAFLLSDTYHCCVNALAMRRPVIGLGQSVAEQRGTLGDYKKKTLFSMFDLSDYYIEQSVEGGDQMSKIVDHAKNYSRDNIIGSYFDTVARKTEAYRTSLVNELSYS